jgi:hypothetical protein
MLNKLLVLDLPDSGDYSEGQKVLKTFIEYLGIKD